MLHFKHILVGISLAGLVSCVNLPVYQAYYATDLSEENKGMQGYDQNSKISWALKQDADYFNLHLRTDDRASILKLLNAGTTIYLDPTGKKKKSISVQYPLKRDKQKNKGGSMQTDISAPNRLISRKSKNNDLQKLLHNLDQRLVYTHFGNSDTLDYSQFNSGIDLSLFIEGNQTFHYKLRIEKQKFLKGDFAHTDNFSLGIISNGMDPANGPRSMEVSNSMRTNNPINRNSRNMGNSPRMQRNGHANRPDFNAISTPINIWFKVNLSQQ